MSIHDDHPLKEAMGCASWVGRAYPSPQSKEAIMFVCKAQQPSKLEAFYNSLITTLVCKV